MNNSIFLSLIQNTAILLSFNLLYEYLWVKNKDSNSIEKQILTGLIIGGIGIVLMLSSWEMAEGMVFDTRSVILSISGLFFGPIPTVIAIFIMGIYRFVIGGEGAFMGIAVIISSGTIGILWNKFRPKLDASKLWGELLLLGFVVHCAMLCCCILLPSELVFKTLSNITLPLLTIYPLGTMLLGLFMYRQLENWENRNALSWSEERYSRLYESMNDAFVVLDLNANIIEFNTPYKEMLGYSKDELLGMNCHELTAEKWRELDKEIIEREVMFSGHSRVYEKECIQKDGVLIPVEIRIHLMKNKEGNPSGFWAMVRDITIRKQAIREMEFERVRLNTILETVPDMIWLKDKDGTYISCNRRFERFMGVEREGLIGKRDHSFFSKEIAEFYFQKDLEVIESNQMIRYTSWGTSAEFGVKVLNETIKTPMLDSFGNLIGVLGVSRDITDIRRTEEELIKAKEKAEESDKLKSIFLANMSHEIRTPMNAIMGFSELLGDPEIDDVERSQYVNIIQNSGSKLLQIINDIVDISKLEMNQLVVKNTDCNLYELFTSCFEVYSRNSILQEKPNLELVLNFPEEYKNLKINTDFSRFQQIMDNLLNNAIKFSESGKIEVGFDFKAINSKGFLEVFVKDQGIGISETKQQLIFERFRQGEEDDFNEGTGLGLSIAKGLVELLGGKIWVESELGFGSTFFYTIPFVLKSKKDQLFFDNGVERVKSDKRNVLLAENDYNSFLLLQNLLEGENFNLLFAENDTAMMEIMEKKAPDLLILDVNILGSYYLGYLKEMRQKGMHTKVIAQAISPKKGEEEKCLRAGCHGYITKPIDKKELLEEMNRVLS